MNLVCKFAIVAVFIVSISVGLSRGCWRRRMIMWPRMGCLDYYQDKLHVLEHANALCNNATYLTPFVRLHKLMNVEGCILVQLKAITLKGKQPIFLENEKGFARSLRQILNGTESESDSQFDIERTQLRNEYVEGLIEKCKICKGVFVENKKVTVRTMSKLYSCVELCLKCQHSLLSWKTQKV